MLRLLLPLALAAGAAAQVPSPADVLGYDLGERFTPHHRVLDYVDAVAEASPHVTVARYGVTPQGRELVYAVISRGQDVEAVRRSTLAATRGEGTPEQPIVWLSYNVHGNESVGTESALETLYQLTQPAFDDILDDVIVVIDPCLNPDGRDRYVHGYQQRQGAHPNADPDAREHEEPWPGGRVNHYLFDLNRDWAWGTQPETRDRLALYNEWMPSVHVDFHEQGVDSPYYFAPAAEPFHPRITEWQRELQTEIGRANAEVFDAEGWLYFTREVFDLFYPGYGDTWPTFNGAVGMTYEQGGSGRAGLAIETAEGDTLTLADRIAHHVASGIETVRTSARLAPEISRQFADFFATPPDGARFYVVQGEAERVEALRQLLVMQGIEARRSPREQTVRGVRYGGGLDRPEEGSATVRQGALVVSTDQPKGRLAAVLFEPEPVLGDSVTYDATAWALPYIYGLEGIALDGDLATDPIVPPPPSAGPAPRTFAYVAEYDSPTSVRFLAGLLREGIAVRIIPEPFVAGGVDYPRGAIVVTDAGNAGREKRQLDGTVRNLAALTRTTLRPLASGFADSGPDVGSNQVGFIRQPSVAVLADTPVSVTALGEVWHYFDAVVDYPATFLTAERLSASDLDGVDVLVMPDGSWGSWLTDRRATTLRDWVRSGGRLIAMERAVTALGRTDEFSVETRDAPDADSTDALPRYGDRVRESVTSDVPGAVYRVTLDDSHPLAFGYPDWTYVLKRRAAGVAFLDEDDGWNVGVVRDGTPTAGFAGAEAQRQLENTLVFGVEEMGQGEVVYLVDSPLFRGFWVDGRLLFGNAVFTMEAFQ